MMYSVQCGEAYFELGHVFTLATRYRTPKTTEEFEALPVIEEQKSVNLIVKHIEALGFSFGKIGCGMTCGLDLEGDVDFDLTMWCLGNEDDFMKAVICKKAQ